jgi:long-chain acyl-CoA synthetase
LTHWIALDPTRRALVDRSGDFTFEELGRHSLQAASGFRSTGVERGGRIAFVGANSAEELELFLACAVGGFVFVPVNSRLARPEMAALLIHAEPSVVVVGDHPDAGLAAFIRDQVHPAMVITSNSYRSWRGEQQPEPPRETPDKSSTLLQLYTSGTTGAPKGVLVSHSALIDLMPDACERWAIDATSVNLVVMPMFHVAGIGPALAGLLSGATTIIHPDVDPVAIVDTIERHRVTNMMVVPIVLQMILDAATGRDLSSLRMITYGASPVSEELLRRARRELPCALVQVYGMTETVGPISQLDDIDHDPDRRPHLLRSCGKPYPWVELRIVDDHGLEVGAGETGEIVMRSAQNTTGYWRNPAATAQLIDADGWLHTGDAGRVVDGYLYLLDRTKDMIVTGGENVYPAEVENVLLAHPAVAEVAVIGIPDERWGEAVHAVVVRRPAHTTIDGDALIDHCRRHIAGYKCPKSVDFVEVLPRNPTGKILKRAVRAPYWEGRDRQV